MLPLTPAAVRRAAGLCLLFSLTLGSEPTLGQGRPASLDGFVDVSSSVVVGRAVATTSAWDPDGRRIMTRVTLAVDETVFGEEATQIELTVPGGRVGNVVQEVTHMPAFVEGEEALVFVWTSPSGRRMVVGGAQGKLDVVREGDGRRVVRGMAGLMGEPPPGGGQPDPASGMAGRADAPVPLSTVIERIRAARN